MSALPPLTSERRERALEVLLGPDLEPIVDMVGWSPAPDTYEVGSADGSVRFTRAPGGELTVESVDGQNPLAVQDPTRFGDLESERKTPHPRRHENSYPNGYAQFAQLFDHPSAPDLCVIHSASHNWEDQGGHLGEHGSLGIVQARAPFIAAGAGVASLGLADIGCRLIDVAPTVLTLLGAKAEAGAMLSHQDGEVFEPLIAEPGRARHVIGFLFDGANPNVLHDLAMLGAAPNVARLMAEGTACRYGALASLPTVTLANHTGILTGSYPGHHGILHNAWVDRASGQQVVTNSPATWATSMQWLNPGIETLHHAIKRHFPGAKTVSINEPCDSGADYSTFELVRNGQLPEPPPGPDDLPDATERFVRPSKDYRWASRADHTAVTQFCSVWGESESTPPTFTWVNFTLTDSAFHQGGPYSEMAAASVADTDARVGRIFEQVERAGVSDDCAFFIVADHGMEESDPEVRGDWDAVLRDSGVAVRDEGYGFLYLP
jgi:arylsulfatase A-like enzyme